ncbi:hypothetical protein D3C76_1330370 [compost metagenome]
MQEPSEVEGEELEGEEGEGAAFDGTLGADVDDVTGDQPLDAAADEEEPQD